MTSTCITVTDPSHVAQARRTATACARAVGFTESDVGRVALVATEAASNVLKHGTAGVILVAAAPSGQTVATAVDVLAIDQGPGMSSVDACLVDGYSTAGSPGTGLGALRRVSSHFDCYSQTGIGTVLLARVAPERAPRAPARVLAGAVAVPYPGETASGDQWAIAFDRLTTTIMVSDGLGHGQSAAEASITATAVFRAQPDAAPAELVTAMHDALRHTRGAAIAVARLEPETARVRYCGVGNISGRIVSGEQVRHLVSHNGTAGRDVRRIQEFMYDWPADGVLVLHSDGIAGRWRLHDYPGLAVRHPSVIAALLYRDFCRGRDDATAVVLQPSGVP